VIARERVSEFGDDLRSFENLGTMAPWLAWPMTIAMLSLAGFPATMGFFGKLYLIDAAVDNGYGWLAVFIVVGSAISLAYYLRVIAAVWMRAPADAATRLAALGDGVRARPQIAGGSPEADDGGAVVVEADDGPVGMRRFQPEVVAVAVLCTAATIFFGIYPSPLLDVARDAGAALMNLV
jgi:NADH-quinone oxidoreductase subunit N